MVTGTWHLINAQWHVKLVLPKEVAFENWDNEGTVCACALQWFLCNCNTNCMSLFMTSLCAGGIVGSNLALRC